MTYTENNIYWIITAQGREYHYPKAIYSLPDAKKHLQKYVDEVGGRITPKKVVFATVVFNEENKLFQ